MEKTLLKHLISIRRKIHANPELGYQEHETSRLISKELTELSITYETNIANTGTGILATVKKGTGKTVLLRADMDALPIHEETDLPFKSLIQNKMHACGHDLHTTILLGAIHLLKEREFKGTIKFLFQPSEEGNKYDPIALPNEIKKSGGERIAESDILNDVVAAIGLHLHPLVPTGKVAFCLGNALAATAFFNVEINGVGGHAAFPHFTVDPIYIASKFILESQAIISRNIDPAESKVLSFTNIRVGKLADENSITNIPNTENIIPEIVNIQGTIRALNQKVFEAIKSKLQSIAKSYKISDGADIKIVFTLDYPILKNDKTVHDKLIPVLEHVFGKECILEVKPLLGGEDFAFYSQKVPSMFYFLGANDGQNNSFLHNPQVVFNEDCIPFGAKLLTNAALELLK